MALDAFSATGNLLLNPIIELWNAFVRVLPGIVAAIIILIIGFFIALGIGHLVKILLEKIGVDNYLKKARMTRMVGHMRISSIFGEIIKWYIFIIFIQAAVDLLNLGALSSILKDFVLWLPNVIAAAIIIIFGVAVAHIIAIKIEEHTEMKGVKFLSKLLKIVLIFMVVVMALNQVGIDASILENTFLLLIGALAVGIAIALGIGLGAGLKPESREIIQDIKNMLKH